MRSRPTVTEVARTFAAYLGRVALRGAHFVLTRAGRPVAELTPVPIGRRLGDLPDLLASLPSLGDDAADFAHDIDRARQEVVAGVAADKQRPVGVVGRFVGPRRFLIVTVYEKT